MVSIMAVSLSELPESLFTHFISLKLIFRVNFSSCSHEMFNLFYCLFEYSVPDNYTLQINPASHATRTFELFQVHQTLPWSGHFPLLICRCLLYHQLVQDGPWQEDHAVLLRKCGCRAAILDTKYITYF